METVRNDPFVRLTYASESRQMVELLRPLLAQSLYSQWMDNTAVLEQSFQAVPTTVREVRWLSHQVLGAWDGETLLGFIEVGTGYDHATLHLSGDRPLGLLRFLALPADYIIASRVAKTLLQAADEWWRESRVQRVRAFSLSTGYPDFQCGAGMLPGQWEDTLHWLTDAGYRMSERYYCMAYPLQRPLLEPLPEGKFSLWLQQTQTTRSYQILVGEERVAEADLHLRQVDVPSGVNPIAYISRWRVLSPWRRRGIGRWLLRRMVNDAYLIGCRQTVLHVNHEDYAAVALLHQVGFEELSYRGYTLEKRL